MAARLQAQTTQTTRSPILAPSPPGPGFRGEAPDRRGPPPWRGLGPMGGGPMGGGPPGGGPPGLAHQPPARPWHEIDRLLQDCRRKYEENLVRRDELIEQLAAEKKKYQPDAVDPASVMRHKAIEKLMGDLHQVVEDGRAGVEEAAELLGVALLTRGVWEAGLRREAPESGPEGPRTARRKAWLEALTGLEREGPEKFVKGLLEDKFAMEALEAMPERLRRGGPPPWPGGAPNPMRRQLLDNIRLNWMGRIERMEKQQEDLRRELQRQERDLRQMRLMLENLLDEPETPEPPAAKQ